MGESFLDLPVPKYDEQLPYGQASQQFMHLRLPASQPRGAVMNIHGGFWRARYDLAHAGSFCAALTSAGYLTFNVEYRRVGEDVGGWQVSLQDVRRAYKFARDYLRREKIARIPFVVTGHSAGGQLALALTAYERTVLQVVSLAGVLDLERAYELHLSDNAVVEYLGDTPEHEPLLYREASPARLKIRARQSIVTGTLDDTVPPSMSRDYAAAKKLAGENVEFIEIAGANHFDLIDPSSEAFPAVLRIIECNEAT